MADFDALARAHMAQQVREAAVIQAAIGRLWDVTIDPNDLEGSFARFEVQARRLVNAGRTKGELTAQTYYDAVRKIAGLEGTIHVPGQPFEDDATQRALYASGFGHAKRRLKEGMSPDQALASAKASMLRAAKRRTLGAGRQRLLDLTAADPDMTHWARVSDGKPCYFCAMLVSRGPVYKATTASFRAHDGCGCSARPVPRNDPTGGWSEDARAYRDLYDSTTTQERYDKATKTWITVPADPRYAGLDWRTAYAKARANGHFDPKPELVPETKPKRKRAPAKPKVVDPLASLPKLKAPDLFPDANVTNPGHVQDADWRNNCHYVVASVELRARGYDVIARPTIEARGRYNAQIERDWKQADGTTRHFTELVPWRSGEKRQTKTLLAEATADWPEGARGYISGAWKTGGGGHIFSFEKTKDGLRFHEGQVPGSDASTYVARMKRDQLAIMRVDDLVPTERLLAAVEPRTAERVAQVADRKSDAVIDVKLRDEEKIVADRIGWNDADVAELRATVADPDADPIEKLYARAYAEAIEKDTAKLKLRQARLEHLKKLREGTS